MRVFVLPSWCPTVDEPLSGTFFLEQAHAIARLRPEWTVAFFHLDLARSRVPWRPKRIPGFVKDFCATPRLTLERAPSGLYGYSVWEPFSPRFGSRQRKLAATASAATCQARRALRDFVDRFGKPDLIHAHAVYPAGAAAVALGREFDVPVGLTEHLGPFPPPVLCLPSGQVIPLVSDTYAELQQCSAVSRALADGINHLGLAREVAVLPNFLPDDFGSDYTIRQEKKGEFVFLSVCWPSHAKGTDVLLNALAKIEGDSVLIIVGDGPERPFFQQMAADLGLENRVRWLGSVPRHGLSEYFDGCDAFVLPSRGETFGVVFIEALAYGKPLIATRCGGPEDIVNPGNGLLVPVGSVDDLALAMQRMITQAKCYAPDVLRADFLARFSASKAVERIEQWYLATTRSSAPASKPISKKGRGQDRLNILVLHSLGNPHLAPAFLGNLVFSLQRNSPSHNYLYHDASLPLPQYVADLCFDAIILDVSFLTARWFDSGYFQARKNAYAFVRDSSAVKIAFPQDEYDCNELLDDWMCEWNVDVVFSVISSGWDVLYPRYHKVGEIRLGYTGYIDESLLERPTKPLSARPIDIGYRAKKLPPYFGRIGENKWTIGQDVALLGKRAGLNIDIELGDHGTLPGNAWLDFIGNTKFSLGANSGSSLLDPKGDIQRRVRAYLAAHPKADFAEVEAECFPGQEGRYSFTAISPRVLEAALLGSAQILVDGEYSGIVKPGEHFIPIRKDAGNFPEVLDAMSDTRAVQRMIARCQEAILSVEALRYGNRARMTLDLIGDLATRKKPGATSGTVEKAISRYMEDMQPKYDALWRRQYFRAKVAGMVAPYPRLYQALRSTARIFR